MDFETIDIKPLPEGTKIVELNTLVHENVNDNEIDIVDPTNELDEIYNELKSIYKITPHGQLSNVHINHLNNSLRYIIGTYTITRVFGRNFKEFLELKGHPVIRRSGGLMVLGFRTK